MKRAILAGILLLSPPAFGQALFTFHTNFWINLHHFLYVLGRARNGAPDSQRAAVRQAPADLQGFDRLTEPERQTWDDAVAWYRDGPSHGDLVFDRDLAAISRSLAAVPDAASLSHADLPAPLRAILERAAPVYRKVWWDRHSRSDQARIEELQGLLNKYGRQIAGRLAGIYHQQWPAGGMAVQVAAYANWAGAYSTDGGLIVMSSTDERTAGSLGLESIFHEAMHQWDDAVIPLLNQTAARLAVRIPQGLFHSLIFYTAGYVVAQVVPGHHPYAEAMWDRGGLPGHAELDAHWLPYLRGSGTFDSAIESLVASFR